MIAEIIQNLDRKKILGKLTLKEVVEKIDKQIDEKGLASITLHPNEHPGELARPRKYEIAAVFNRMRTAKVRK